MLQTPTPSEGAVRALLKTSFTGEPVSHTGTVSNARFGGRGTSRPWAHKEKRISGAWPQTPASQPALLCLRLWDAWAGFSAPGLRLLSERLAVRHLAAQQRSSTRTAEGPLLDYLDGVANPRDPILVLLLFLPLVHLFG